jgi:hypothetical protein
VTSNLLVLPSPTLSWHGLSMLVKLGHDRVPGGTRIRIDPHGFVTLYEPNSIASRRSAPRKGWIVTLPGRGCHGRRLMGASVTELTTVLAGEQDGRSGIDWASITRKHVNCLQRLFMYNRKVHGFNRASSSYSRSTTRPTNYYTTI